mmetsp:Transcript_133252/g.242718  ORF Transcript_133252/g.242718 Transcript_133252/m.242718 type:complete len:142 (-) Transcript_133252:35-460(-)
MDTDCGTTDAGCATDVACNTFAGCVTEVAAGCATEAGCITGTTCTTFLGCIAGAGCMTEVGCKIFWGCTGAAKDVWKRCVEVLIVQTGFTVDAAICGGAAAAVASTILTEAPQDVAGIEEAMKSDPKVTRTYAVVCFVANT